ncbi:hypothetical protein RZS28_14450 [Methylocapsa polymorpha]|uniref:Uncharacterized protein n=1 Tax=Methylocapsa polymorpha TaxID=3080828 RepID=A0ABZ0HRL7_9HYPH|nr:hypothetical protein RZS28_14450 [Methylocapsa sp. RX1]
MGLRDVMRGVWNGPRGEPQTGASSGKGGMSRIMMAILAFFAYKAFTRGGGQAPPNDPTLPPESGPPPRRWL